MASRLPPSATFVRDSAVATLCLALAFGLFARDVEPGVLQIPGLVLWIPYMILSIKLGFSTPPHVGPSLPHLAGYLVVLGMGVGWFAGLARDADVQRGSTDWRVAVLVVVPAVLLALILFYFGVFLGAIPRGVAFGGLVLVAVGLAAVGVRLWLRERADG